jgi:adenosylmethionine---8-amino-7-oxononanoate aminotransferase
LSAFTSLIRQVFHLTGHGGKEEAAARKDREPVQLTRAEMRELERVLSAEITRYFDHHGAASLLDPGLCVLIDGSELAIQPRPTDLSGFLACVDLRSLFTAKCALAVGLEQTTLTRDALPDLAAEATAAIASQIKHVGAVTARRPVDAIERGATVVQDGAASRISAPPDLEQRGAAPSNNPDAMARSLAAVWHPCTQMKHHERFPLLPISRGKGVWLYDFDGKPFLDAVSSWWVNLFGHANPRINAALKAQLDQLEHVMLAGFTHEPVIELSERLAKLSGLGHAFYGSDGTSAVEIALKMSFHYWRNRGAGGKKKFVALHGSYHGETLGALSVTDVAIFRDAYAPLLCNHLLTPFPARGTRKEAGDGFPCCSECAVEAASVLERLLAERHEEIAALIVEPLVQGAAGMRMYHPDYLRRAHTLCARYGVHLIADEIMTGFGRTGTMFAFEQAGITPDFLCLSKGITGGYLPLSCVLTSDEVFSAFYDDDAARGFLHSHSYSGNALACRAALATLDIFEQDDVLAANRDKSMRFTTLAKVLAEHPSVGNFRHLGMIWAFEVQSGAADFSRRAFALALERGVLLRPIGNTIYFMPPYVIGDDEFRLLVETALFIVNRLGAES